MRVAVFGLGYVGCTAVACIAKQGHEVVGVDVSAAKVAALAAGRSPIEEPEVARLLAAAAAAGRLTAATEIGSKLADCQLAIVCVGTPSGPDGAHNMSFIVQVSRQIAAAVRGRSDRLTVAYRSTMRPGSIERIIAPIFHAILGEEGQDCVELVYNPEFLREGSAVHDYFHPPKIVVGTHNGQPSETMDELHRGIDAPLFAVPFREAELTKFVDNSWHAVKVAFANEMGRLCQAIGISAATMHTMFVSDTKLNVSAYYLRPGGPFGGSCLPKDVRALVQLAGEHGAAPHLVDSLLRSNEAHKLHQFRLASAGLASGARVLLAGLAFKANTDDLRESPAVDLARRLLDAGVALDIYDPALQPARLIGQNLGYAYAHLPTIDTLLVDRTTAEARRYDRLVLTSRVGRELQVEAREVLDLSTIP